MGPFSSKGMQDLIKEMSNLSKTIVEPSTEYWDKFINTEYFCRETTTAASTFFNVCQIGKNY